jgi:hypothetical protein
MSDSKDLERRYRRLLAFYPQAFRREHGQEILSVLIAGAVDGQRRPGLAESANLVRHGIWMRVRQPTAWEEQHHPTLWIWVRMLIGIWLLFLTGVLCQYGHWWAVVLFAPAALNFYLAVRIARFGSPPVP